MDNGKIEVKVDITLGVEASEIEKLLEGISGDKMAYHLANALMYGCKLSNVQVRGASLNIDTQQG